MPPLQTRRRLRTPGATDFFRLIHEEAAIMERISSGEVLYTAALRSLGVMRDFVDALTAALGRPVPLETLCALLNNATECYELALQFVEAMQASMEPEYAARIDVEDTCRGFLETAKAAAKRVVEVVFADAGMAGLLGQLFAAPDWSAGRTMRGLLATLGDYLGDAARYVDPSFFKRIADFALDELVGRYVSGFAAAAPKVTEPLTIRMANDELDLQRFFEKKVRSDRVMRATSTLMELRELLTAAGADAVAAAYARLLGFGVQLTPQALERALSGRSDLKRAELKDALLRAREAYAQKQAAAAPPPPASANPSGAGGRRRDAGGGK